MKSVVCHFYNEEYLLPWWLEHHKKFFDYGLMINYQSTDRSVDIIKDICPDWQVVDSINTEFDAILLDQEVMYYEKQIPGWKICLNVPEFLYGNYSILNEDSNPQEHYIPTYYMVDPNQNTQPDLNKPLHEQFKLGLDYIDQIPYRGNHPVKTNISSRYCRVIHNHFIEYSPGRHFNNYPDNPEFVILYYNLAPFNEDMIKRKLQIQFRLSERFKDQHHKMTREELFETREKYFLPFTMDLSSNIDKFVNMCYHKEN